MRAPALALACALGSLAVSAGAQEIQEQPGVTILPAPAPREPPPPAVLLPPQTPTPPEQPTMTAPPAELPPRPPPRRAHRWYGYQTLIADGAMVALGSIGLALKEPTLSTVGSVGYFLGGPILHWAHQRVGTGFADLGLRVAFPIGGLIVGALVGAIAAPKNGSVHQDSNTILVATGIGAAGGVVAAVVFDAAILAEETVHVEPGEARQRPDLRAPPPRVAPQLLTGKNYATFGLAGTF